MSRDIVRNPLLVPEIIELLEDGRHDDLIEVLGELHPNDAASILSGLDEPHIVQVMSLLPIEMERDVFGYFDPEVQENIVLGSGRPRVRALLLAMASDDRAEFIDSLDERVREQMIPLLTRAVREDLVRREQYDDDQVGSLLSTDYLVLDPDLTAAQALDEIRRQEPSKETIYHGFVVDRSGVLLGIVSLRKLLIAPPHRLVGEVMSTALISVHATDDQELAAAKIREYDLLAIPVTDDSGHLLGIVTHDDAADILEEEAEEDIQMMAGITSEERQEGYSSTPVWTQFRRRVPVLAVLATSFVFIGYFIGHFHEQFTRWPIVAMTLLPMIMATGGNVGNQASTAVILGLRHDLTPTSFARVLWKELRVGLSLAAVLSLIAGIEAFFLLEPGSTAFPLMMCGAIALAVAMHVVTAALLGGAIPLAVSASGRDPAMVAHPALATIADLVGAVIYLVTLTTLVPVD